jgi:hypothetical protein
MMEVLYNIIDEYFHYCYKLEKCTFNDDNMSHHIFIFLDHQAQ